MRSARLALVGCFVAIGLPLVAPAESFDPALFRELRWRMIGPHRGGRTKAATGVPGRPGLFYVGACNGGVWKTTDYGRVWTPIFDDQPTGSIGAIAIAPSNPDVIYDASPERHRNRVPQPVGRLAPGVNPVARPAEGSAPRPVGSRARSGRLSNQSGRSSERR